MFWARYYRPHGSYWHRPLISLSAARVGLPWQLLYARLNGVPMHLELPRARMVAEQVSLDGDPLNQKACELSGGMRRRLSIGISIICDPKVLFLDEPTTGAQPPPSTPGSLNRRAVLRPRVVCSLRVLRSCLCR